MILEKIPQINELSTEEKLQLASEIWDENLDRVSSEESQAVLEQLLQERLDEYRKNPDAVVSLDEVRRKAGLK